MKIISKKVYANGEEGRVRGPLMAELDDDGVILTTVDELTPAELKVFQGHVTSIIDAHRARGQEWR